MSLIISETVLSQTFVKNKKGKIVGIITEKGDSLHVLPIVESRLVHEAAVKKLHLDRKILVKDSLITNLEHRLYQMESGYEDLMTTSGETADELRKQIRTTKDHRDELRSKARRLKKMLFWANARTVTITVISGIVIWLVAK